MRKKYFILSLLFLFLAFGACEKEDKIESLNDSGKLKSLVTDLNACNEGDFYTSFVNFSNSPGGFVSNGWVLIRNNEIYLNLYMKPVNGFQDLPDNVDIGVYTGSLPSGLPDVNSFNYHFTTGGISGEIGYHVDLPMDNIYIENLGTFESINCGEPIFIVVHYDALDESGNPFDVWTGFNLIEGYSADNNYFWYKHIEYIPVCCISCTDETAWAEGLRYVRKGNWATYTPYDGESMSVKLFAGQNMEAGMVYFTPAIDGVNIHIELYEGWSLLDDDESVKIQGYETAPTSNPEPGLFKTYKGISLDVNVPSFNFYGVHLDLQHCK